MVVTGELTSGSIGIMLTIFMAAVAWWVKSDRQSTRFDVLLAQLKVDIEANRKYYMDQTSELRAEQKALATSVNDIKLQLAAMQAQQSLAGMFASLPADLARAMGDARGRHWERERDRAHDRDAAE